MEEKITIETLYLQKLIGVIDCAKDVVTFLHNTKTKETAEKILREGFEFQSHLDYTTDIISCKDPITIKYFSLLRKAYGDYTMVIQIADKIIHDFSEPLANKAHHFSEILAIKEPVAGQDEDKMYCLAPNFVKGYIDSKTAEFIPNPAFDPNLILPIFHQNLQRVLNEMDNNK